MTSFVTNASLLMLLAKATLILVVALGITVAMQRASAGARHLVWLVTLGTLLFVPALAAWSPLRMRILPAVPQPVEAPHITMPSSSPLIENGDADTQGIANASTVSTPSDAERPALQLGGLSGFPLLIAVWGTVVLALALWLAYGALAVKRIVRNSRTLDTQDWKTPLWEIADRLELDEAPLLVASAEAKMPFACGFTKATIVLPADCDAWTVDRRRAVLLHELAHVKRRDLVGHTLGRIACAFYWFHPLVWTAAKQLRNESERACDDLALSCGAKASDYAEHLLDIVTSVRHDSTPVVAMAMARRKEFEGRMLAILDPQLRHSSPNRRQAGALAGSLALIAIVVGAAAPTPRESIVVTSAVPTATATPVIDKSFTPSDEATPKPEAKVEKKRERKETVQSTVEEKTSRTYRMLEPIEGATVITIDPEVAYGVAARALARIGATDLLQAGKTTSDERPAMLANILRTDADPSLRRVAAWGLSEYAETQVATEALAHALRRDADVRVREMAGWALADTRSRSVGVAALTEALRSDANEKVRGIAAWSLGRVGDREAVPALVAALAETNKGIRARALWAIGSIEPKTAPAALYPLLRDADPMIRQLTAWALFQIEDPAAAAPLNAALKAESVQELRIDYIKALAAIGEQSVDAIRDLLLSTDPKIRSIAVRALAGGNGNGPWPWPWPEPRPQP